MACDRVVLSLGIALALLAGGCGGGGSAEDASQSSASSPAIATAPSEKTQPTVADGEALFERNGCMNCHRYRGRGSPTPGPDLDGAGKHDAEWHLAHLRDPRSKSPDSDMPSYSHLADDELRVLAEWLSTRK